MRTLPLLAGALLAAPLAVSPVRGQAAPPPRPPTSPAAAAVRAVADEFVAEAVRRSPERGEAVGDATPPDRWIDNAPAALRAWEAREDAWLSRLAAIDGGALLGTPEWQVHGALRETLEAARAQRVCRRELWGGVDQIFGWHLDLASAAARQPVGTPAARAAALARWGRIPALVETETANAREGLARGYAAPRDNVLRVIEQVRGIIADSVQASPFWAVARRDSTPGFHQAWARVVRDQANPALRRYLAFLEGEYLPRAHAGSGVGALPDGAACYRAIVRGYTSLDVAPVELRDRARRARAGIEGELSAVAARLTGEADVRRARRILTSDARFTFPTREARLEAASAQLQRLRSLLPRAFSRVPTTPLLLEAAPAYAERSSPPAWYDAAPLDGSRPATYFLNLGSAVGSPRMDIAPSTTHEGWPGHHHQIAWVRERPVAHPVLRLVRTDAYVEGWAMYAERLAYETLFEDDDLMRAGLLAHLTDALVGLEVDPGIHVFGWTREAAVDSMMAISARPRAQAESYADRHSATPGQIVTYMTGYLEIIALREEARAALGPRFSLHEFHDVVLDEGPVTLAMLRTRVERWIASKRGG